MGSIPWLGVWKDWAEKKDVVHEQSKELIEIKESDGRKARNREIRYSVSARKAVACVKLVYKGISTRR